MRASITLCQSPSDPDLPPWKYLRQQNLNLAPDMQIQIS